MNRFSRLFAVLAAAAVLVAGIAIHEADARAGGGSSGGSRGGRTFSAPAATPTAPRSAAPMERTMTQPGAPGSVTQPAANPGGGFFNRPGGMFGGGMLGGLAAGFLGAGLMGMLMGHGFLGGLGGFASILGLILQVALVVVVARLAWAWWQRRNQPALASGPSYRDNANGRGMGGLAGFGLGGGGSAPAPKPAEPSDDIGIKPSDYDAFEKVLTDVQTSYGNGDIDELGRHVTPEMLSYFAGEIANNTGRGVVNELSDVKLLQGDLAEAWRENNVDYATVAMRYSLVDRVVDRATGRVVEGDERPQEVVEVWTFLRPHGGSWVLSAIQQAG